jgi:hypothetical protein
MTAGAIEISEVRNASEWHQLFAKVDRKYMTQTWAFGEAKRATGWLPQRLVLSSGNEVLAICQVLHRFFGSVLVASRINLGPMMLQGSDNRSAEVHRALRRRWSFLRRGVLLVAPALEHTAHNQNLLSGAGFRVRSNYRWSSSLLDLTQGEQWLRSSLESKWRNQLKKAEQSSLLFSCSTTELDAQRIIEHHAMHLREKSFEGPSPKFLSALYQASPNDFIVYRATQIDGDEDLAGIVVYRFQDHAHYYIGWNGPKGRQRNTGNFLLWNAALDLKRRGCHRFDLGGHSIVVRSGISKFKLGMGGSCYETVGEFYCF